MTKIALLILAASATAVAQPTGSITGTVTDAITRLPLHHAIVSAASGSRDVTAADGTFYLPDLPAGEVKLHLVAAGYRSTDTSVKISDGDRLSSYFELHPMAQISGKITDKDTGAPVSRQFALAPRNGGLILGGASSDKDGAFSMDSLEPGDYTLTINPLSGEAAISWDPPTKTRSVPSYGLTSYPETIHLAEGEQRFVDMRVTSKESHSVAGSIEFPPGLEEAPVSVGYSSPATGIYFMQAIGKHRAGAFRIDGLLPGAWQINVTAGADATRSYGTLSVTIEDHDIEGQTIKLIPGVNITASIRIAEPDVPLPSKLPNITTLLLATSQTPGARSEIMQAITGQFHDEGVAPGEYWPELDGLPDGFAVNEVLFDNVSTLNRPVSLNGPAEITFVVTSKPGAVKGTLLDHSQLAIKGATVELVPDAYKDIPDPPSHIRMQCGPSGEFQFRNLAPGKYSIDGAADFVVKPGETTKVVVIR